MKKSLKQTLDLFLLDWKRIIKNRPTLLLMLALMFLPSLYAWFNIAALWDPYNNTKDLAIAVYSEDQPVTVFNQEISVGSEMMTNLKENDAIGWRFVNSRSELERGVKSGEFYGGIYLPKEFSADLVAFIEGDVKKPVIEYQVNQKINAIAPKIADKGASTIKETISQEFIASVSETLLQVFNDIGFSLDDNVLSLTKLKSKLLTLDDNLGTLDGYTQQIVALNEQLPEYQKKLKRGNEMLGFLPEINQMGEKIIAVNQRMPQLKESGQLIFDIQEKVPEIEGIAQKVQQIDEDFVSVIEILNQSVSEAKEGLEIITQVQSLLPDVERLAETANQLIPTLVLDVTEIQQALPQIAAGAGTGIQVIVAIAEEIASITEQLATLLEENELTAEQRRSIQQTLVGLNQELASLSEMLASTSQMLQKIQELTESTSLQGIIDLLNISAEKASVLQEKTRQLIEGFEGFTTQELQQSLQLLSQESGDLARLLRPITPTVVNEKVAPLLSQLQEMLDAAGNITGTIVNQDLVQQLNELLTSTTTTLTESVTFLESYQTKLPVMKDKIHVVNAGLDRHLARLVAGINQSAEIYEKDFPLLEGKMEQAANFVTEDWPELEKSLLSTIGNVNEKFPVIEGAVGDASKMIVEDWPDIQRSIHKAANLVRQGEEDIDLQEIIRLLKSDVKAESDFLANPIDLEQTDIYPVPNNGSASAPFYVALCLWVGAVLFSSIASTQFQLSKDEEKKYSMRQQFVARMGTFLVVAFFQALIVSLGNQWLLGTYTVAPVWSVLFAVFVGLTFMMIVYVLVALFGNLGKGAAVILLVLSISAGGGNYPIEMSSPFFQKINPFIPFTHAVNLLREPVGGIYWPNTLQAMLILGCIFVSFALLGMYLYPKVQPLIQKLNAELCRGKILH